MNRNLLSLIQSTLQNEWDPIGLGGHGPEDEYHSYALQVYGQLVQGWERDRIADYLHQIATVHMGLPKTPYQLSLRVATRLAHIQAAPD